MKNNLEIKLERQDRVRFGQLVIIVYEHSIRIFKTGGTNFYGFSFAALKDYKIEVKGTITDLFIGNVHVFEGQNFKKTAELAVFLQALIEHAADIKGLEHRLVIDKLFNEND